MQETHLEAGKIALPLLLSHTSAILTALVATSDAVAHEEASATFQNVPAPSKTSLAPEKSPHSPRNTSTPSKAHRGLQQPGGASSSPADGGSVGPRVWTWQRARGMSSMDASSTEASSDMLGADRQRSASMHVTGTDGNGSPAVNGNSEGTPGDRAAGETVIPLSVKCVLLTCFRFRLQVSRHGIATTCYSQQPNGLVCECWLKEVKIWCCLGTVGHGLQDEYCFLYFALFCFVWS